MTFFSIALIFYLYEMMFTKLISFLFIKKFIEVDLQYCVNFCCTAK